MWPENWPVVMLFSDVQTQWRVGFGGAYGLDYNVVAHEMELMDLPRDQRRAWMADIRVLEAAALAQMAENQEKD